MGVIDDERRRAVDVERHVADDADDLAALGHRPQCAGR